MLEAAIVVTIIVCALSICGVVWYFLRYRSAPRFANDDRVLDVTALFAHEKQRR